MTRTHTYAIVDELGDETSADAHDYWYLADADSMSGALVRMDHPYRTVTGRTIHGPRVIREYATARDLRRLSRAQRKPAGPPPEGSYSVETQEPVAITGPRDFPLHLSDRLAVFTPERSPYALPDPKPVVDALAPVFDLDTAMAYARQRGASDLEDAFHGEIITDALEAGGHPRTSRHDATYGACPPREDHGADLAAAYYSARPRTPEPEPAPIAPSPRVRKTPAARTPSIPKVGTGKHARCVAHEPMPRTTYYGMKPGVAYACFDEIPDHEAIALRRAFVDEIDAAIARHAMDERTRPDPLPITVYAERTGIHLPLGSGVRTEYDRERHASELVSAHGWNVALRYPWFVETEYRRLFGPDVAQPVAA